MWAAVAPSFPELHPFSWIPVRWAGIWSGRGGEDGYAGLPLVDTEMGSDAHGCFTPAEPSATLYEPPPQETTALLQNHPNSHHDDP